MAEKEKDRKKTYNETITIQRANDKNNSTVKSCSSGRTFLLAERNQYCCYQPAITVSNCTNDTLYRIYPCEIIYIAIENRRSVLYLINRKIETNCNISYWKNILDESTFAQPHYSFIVNLNYVSELTRDKVKLTYEDKEYSVYTSSRKFTAFKKALLNFTGCD